MNRKLDDLKALIVFYSMSGKISLDHRNILISKAADMNISESELDVLIRSVYIENRLGDVAKTGGIVLPDSLTKIEENNDKTFSDIRVKRALDEKKITSREYFMILQASDKLNISPDDMYDMFSSNNLDDIKQETTFEVTSKAMKIVLICFAVFVVGVLIYLFVDVHNSRKKIIGKKSDFTGLKNMPISESDLIHIYSSNCDGKAVLVSVKSLKNEDGKLLMYYDLKTDFFTVATNCKCEINLKDKRFDFSVDYNKYVKEINLGDGIITRSPAGKIILVPSNGKCNLTQL